MASLEAYCDSDEEVFFGPVTEKEKLIYQALKLKEIHKGIKEEVCDRYVGGDEGLHALAEAASMLSISSGDEVRVKEEKISQGSFVEEDGNFCETSATHVGDDTGITNGNEGSTMELDAVKFLTKHIPEQHGKCEVIDQTESIDETYQSPGVAHHTSLASYTENSSSSNNNPISCNSPADSFLVLEAQCKIEDTFEREHEKLIPIRLLEQLPPLDLSTTDMQDVNDKSDFEMKLSDNEEEIEKVERNLKVEEIIKFLAEEETNIGLEEKEETCLENSCQDKSYQNHPPLDSTLNRNEKFNEDDDDVIVIEINDDELVGLTDCKSSGQLVELPEASFEKRDDKEISKEVAGEIVDLTDCKSNGELLKSPKASFEETDNKQISEEVAHEIIDLTNGKSNGELEKLPKASLEETDDQKISKEIAKIPKLKINDRGVNESSHLPVMKQHGKGSSFNSKDSSVTHRRLKTPSKVQLRPVHGLPSQGSSNLHKQLMVGGIKSQRCHLMSPVTARNDLSSARTPVKGANGTFESNFKTPNSKVNTMAASKIPQITPSPRSKKYTDIISPVAQYIHGRSALFVSNKTALPIKSDTAHRERVKYKTGVSDKTNTVDRGTENIDVNNFVDSPIPSNINYKSAVPMKIFSPSPIKSSGNGPVISVSKHIGRIQIPSLKTGEVQLQCRESLIPDGEVSVLVTKEVKVERF